MTIALLGALALAATAPVLENWVKIFTTDTGLVTYVDRDTIQRDGDAVLAWERRDYANVQGGDYKEMRIQSRFDCRARTVQVRAAIVTFRAGGDPQRFSWDDAPVDPAQAQTLAGEVLSYVCDR